LTKYKLLKSRIKKNEGYKSFVYFDQLGFPTIGHGHLIKPNEKIFFKIKNNEIISFDIEDQSAEILRSEFEDQNSSLNPYYQRFKTHEFDLDVNDEVFNLKYSKYGLIELKKTFKASILTNLLLNFIYTVENNQEYSYV